MCRRIKCGEPHLTKGGVLTKPYHMVVCFVTLPHRAESMRKDKVKNMTEGIAQLVGYVRRSNAGAQVKISINLQALKDCNTYTTADGQTYVPLVMSRYALEKVLNGERAITTVSQIVEEE